MQDAPMVLVVGSHPVMLEHAVQSLRAAGYDAVGRIGLAAATALMDERAIDALIVGGPAAHAVQDELVSRLRARHPYARVIDPRGPGGVVEAVEDAFGADAN